MGLFLILQKGEIVYVEESMSSDSYIAILRYIAVPFLDHALPARYVYQQVYIPTICSNCSIDVFKHINVESIPSPARGLNLRPIQNLWGRYLLPIYPEYWQYNDIDGLAEAIEVAWNNGPLMY